MKYALSGRFAETGYTKSRFYEVRRGILPWDVET